MLFRALQKQPPLATLPAAASRHMYLLEDALRHATYTQMYLLVAAVGVVALLAARASGRCRRRVPQGPVHPRPVLAPGETPFKAR